jgi:hypothetical protein
MCKKGSLFHVPSIVSVEVGMIAACSLVIDFVNLLASGANLSKFHTRFGISTFGWCPL